MDISTLTFLMILISAQSVQMHPLTLYPWMQPCGRPLSNASLVMFPETKPVLVVELVSSSIIQMKEIRDLVQNLRSIYKTNRVVTSDSECTKNLDAPYVHLENFPLPPTVEESIQPVKDQNVSQILKNDFKVLSTVMVFVEQMKMDEDVYESRQHSSSIRRIFTKFLSVLCNLWKAMEQEGETVTDYAHRSVLKEEYRIMSRSDNYDRDYIVLKDTDDLLASMILKYSVIKNILSGDTA